MFKLTGTIHLILKKTNIPNKIYEFLNAVDFFIETSLRINNDILLFSSIEKSYICIKDVQSILYSVGE